MALFLQVMIDRTCRVRDVTEGRTGVALASSISCAIKAKVGKVGRYYWAGKSQGRILSWL